MWHMCNMYATYMFHFSREAVRWNKQTSIAYQRDICTVCPSKNLCVYHIQIHMYNIFVSFMINKFLLEFISSATNNIYTFYITAIVIFIKKYTFILSTQEKIFETFNHFIQQEKAW